MYLNDTNMAKNTNLKNTSHDLNLKNENKSEISTFFRMWHEVQNCCLRKTRDEAN